MSKKAITFVILSSLVIGGIGGWLFNRYLIPKINTISFLVKYNLAPQTAPLIINRREEIRVNEGSDSIAAIQKVKPWVVGIVSGADLGHAQVASAGVVLTSDGLIAASKNSLLATVKTVNVSFSDGTFAPATEVASDPASDLVFLKVDKTNLATASLGYSKDMQLGQRIIVLSPTLNEFQPVDQVAYLAAEVKNIANKTYSTDLINQTFKVDDLVNVPDGSMVLSLDANVQGIYSGSTVITADTIRSALNSYFSTGKIVRNHLGFSYAPVSKIMANAFGATSGVLVKKPDSKSNLLDGDLITAVNGTAINIDNSFEDQIQKAKVGDVLDLQVIRNKLSQSIKITVGAE
ncbi:MAG: peptidase [Candidatus Doudnabacteria bacterium]|nr:peptidase [Candidatus Doudnabacteria bacterium]